MISSRVPRMLATIVAALVVVAAAAPVSWKDYDKGVELMQKKMRAALLFFEGGDSFSQEAGASLFSDKQFLSKLKKAIPIRVESGNEDTKELCEKYKVVPGAGAIVVLDVQGEMISRFSQDLEVEKVKEALVTAIEVSEKKADVLKVLDKAFGKAKKGMKSKNYAVALKNFNLVLQIKKEKGEIVDSPLYGEAESAIEEIRTEARTRLSAASQMIEKKQYAKAKNLAKSVAQAFPDEQIQAEAQGVVDLVEQKIRDQYKGR